MGTCTASEGDGVMVLLTIFRITEVQVLVNCTPGGIILWAGLRSEEKELQCSRNDAVSITR